MLAHAAACETGRPASRKKAGRTCKILGTRGQNRRKSGQSGRQNKKPQFAPSAPHRLSGADIAYIHCGVDGWRCCLSVVGVLGRKRLSCAFSPSARPASAVQSVLDAAGGLPPDQIRGIRVRRGGGLQYTSGGLGKAMSILGIKAEHIRVGTPQQNGYAGSSRNTPRRGCIRTRDLESF